MGALQHNNLGKKKISKSAKSGLQDGCLMIFYRTFLMTPCLMRQISGGIVVLENNILMKLFATLFG